MNQKIKITVIAWDLHGVLFVKSIWHWFYLIITFPGLFQALWKMSFSGYVLIMKYILRKIGIYKKEITNEELINVCQNDDNYQMIALIKRVSCDYVPNVNMIALVKKFHDLGIQQDIVSNIGETVFTQFKQMYPDVFIYFKNFFTVTVQSDKPILKKPDPAYFKAYLDKYNYVSNEILFIDDNYNNVESAKKIGIFAFNFSSVALLKKDLDSLNLF